jgi:hypothetical protein
VEIRFQYVFNTCSARDFLEIETVASSPARHHVGLGERLEGLGEGAGGGLGEGVGGMTGGVGVGLCEGVG